MYISYFSKPNTYLLSVRACNYFYIDRIRLELLLVSFRNCIKVTNYTNYVGWRSVYVRVISWVALRRTNNMFLL